MWHPSEQLQYGQTTMPDEYRRPPYYMRPRPYFYRHLRPPMVRRDGWEYLPRYRGGYLSPDRRDRIWEPPPTAVPSRHQIVPWEPSPRSRFTAEPHASIIGPQAWRPSVNPDATLPGYPGPPAVPRAGIQEHLPRPGAVPQTTTKPPVQPQAPALPVAPSAKLEKTLQASKAPTLGRGVNVAAPVIGGGGTKPKGKLTAKTSKATSGKVSRLSNPRSLAYSTPATSGLTTPKSGRRSRRHKKRHKVRSSKRGRKSASRSVTAVSNAASELTSGAATTAAATTVASTTLGTPWSVTRGHFDDESSSSSSEELQILRTEDLPEPPPDDWGTTLRMICTVLLVGTMFSTVIAIAVYLEKISFGGTPDSAILIFNATVLR